jgi:hypothetical protein
VGSAGEHYVLYKLHRHGMLSAPAPRGYKAVDLIVLNPDRSVAASLQVKTRTKGRDGGWHMGEKHETIVLPALFYCFVDFQAEMPVTYIVPSRVVAEVVSRAYRAWLAAPGKRGKPHQETTFRRVQPSYDFPVPGYDAGWMDQYRENWALLRATAAVPAALPGEDVGEVSERRTA